jgi:hypothetical protein
MSKEETATNVAADEISPPVEQVCEEPCEQGSSEVVEDSVPCEHPKPAVTKKRVRVATTWLDGCSGCHNGTQATGKPATHIASTLVCEACHATTAWRPTTKVDHTQVQGTCAACHNGTSATGKPANHIPTTQNCDACHATLAWRPSTFTHAGAIGGQVVAMTGNRVSAGGILVGAGGHLVSTAGQKVSPLGHLVAAGGHLVSTVGQRVSTPGQAVARMGAIVGAGTIDGLEAVNVLTATAELYPFWTSLTGSLPSAHTADVHRNAASRTAGGPMERKRLIASLLRVSRPQTEMAHHAHTGAYTQIRDAATAL